MIVKYQGIYILKKHEGNNNHSFGGEITFLYEVNNLKQTATRSLNKCKRDNKIEALDW